MKRKFQTVDLLMAEVAIGPAPFEQRDKSGLAFRTGQTDRHYGIDENPFLLPHNRDEWERGYRRGLAR